MMESNQSQLKKLPFFSKYNSYYVGNPNEKSLYLTFDAGYENGTTESILNTLKKHNVKAHFSLWKVI